MAKKKTAAARKSKTAASKRGNPRTSASGRKVKQSRSKTAGPKSESPKVDIVIRRSTGRTERFDSDRMAQTVSRSGTPFMLAKDIAEKVSRRVRTESNEIAREVESNKEHPSFRGIEPRTIEVDGADVREMVAEELREANRPEIALSYSGERAENAGVAKGEILDSSKEPQSGSQAAKHSKLVYDSTTQYAKH
ncbi:MAG: hypothetical protein ABI361_04175 [Nitrososphaera sp.]|jgi:hypothetical protein